MLDLFSGLGGASQAFVESDSWEVVRIDNNPAFADLQNTYIEDILELATMVESEELKMDHFDLIWASPPCLPFSLAYSSPKSIALRADEEYEPDMSLIMATRDLIYAAKKSNPKITWVVENVAGAVRHFEPIFGQPRQVVSSFHLWGNFPLLDIPRGWRHSKYEEDTWSTDPLRANKRAKVPWTISEALRLAFTTQTRLDVQLEYLD
jgi:hypothetical protein